MMVRDKKAVPDEIGRRGNVLQVGSEAFTKAK